LLLPPIFISDFTDLGVFHPHFSQIGQGLVNLIYFLQGPAFCFVDSLYGFLVSVPLILALVFITSLSFCWF
jgi:hypothetical protein